MLLASFIPALGATTWPAGTNTANQTFYGNNNFLGSLKQNGVDVLTNGATGPQGIQGIPGTNGLNGVNGTNGLPGINGTNGISGINGTNGVNGTNGLSGLNGTNGLAGINGTNAAVGLVTNDFTITLGLSTNQFSTSNSLWIASNSLALYGTGVSNNVITLGTTISNKNYLTANQTITLSGDTTGSGTTSITTTTTNLSGSYTNRVVTTNDSRTFTLSGASVSNAATATTATNLIAPPIITWSGPTNSLTLGYPWSNTTYVITSDISVTNFLGITNGYPCESSFELTNSTATSCAVRFPTTAIGYGTLITNETAYVLAGKKAIVAVSIGSATNWAIVQQSQ
jgi:hypothetical protein